MLHPAWVAREAPLARCPLGACRRSHTCRHPGDADPCRRLHETKEAMRSTLADKLENMAAQARRRDPHGMNFAAEGTPEFEERMKFLYESVRAADEANCAAQKAAAQAQKNKKPVTPRAGG